MKKIVRAATVPLSLEAFCRDMLRELSQEYEVVAVSSPGKVLDEVGEREGVRTIAVPMERHISLFRDLKSLWKMWRVLRREKPDMIHSMTPKAGLICMMAGWLAGVPVRVHTFTGLVWPTSTGLKRRILMATDWLTCACATHIIPEGEGVKSDLLNHHITRKPLKILGYGNVKGIDLDYFKPAETTSKSHQGFTFVFVGRIVRDKGINELVKAFDRLHQEHNDVRLVLVGPREDDLDPVLPETLERIDRGEGIEAVGKQSDVKSFYTDADALVFPSYREGFPNVVIEAGAMGLPSIVTDINGSREIIINGQNGIIVPPQDEEALYQAMKLFVEDPELTQSLAGNARSLIASRYEQGYVRKCLYDYYHEILN